MANTKDDFFKDDLNPNGSWNSKSNFYDSSRYSTENTYQHSWRQKHGRVNDIKTVIIFHPDIRIIELFIKMMERLPINVQYIKATNPDQLRGYERTIPIWIYNPSSWSFRYHDWVDFMNSRFENVKVIPELKNPFLQDFMKLFDENININHNNEECEAYKEFTRLVRDEKVDENKALKAVCALFEIQPNQLFLHSECERKAKERKNIKNPDWNNLEIRMNGSWISDVKNITVNMDFGFGDFTPKID